MTTAASQRRPTAKSVAAKRWRSQNASAVRARDAARRAAYRDRVGPRLCTGCGDEVTSRRGPARCAACRLEAKRASYVVRDRRVRDGRPRDLTASVVRELKRAAVACPLCRSEFSEERRGPSAKHLDHIVPIAAGGAHTRANVRVICESCNLRRPSDGSDLEQSLIGAIA